MRKLVFGFGIMLAAVTGSVAAMEGVFDRSADVQKYVATIRNGTRPDVIIASKEIYVSGLSDPQLGQALSDRLLRDYPSLTPASNRADSNYAVWLVKALASLGRDSDVDTLGVVAKSVKRSTVAIECRDEIELIPWHRRKNEIMASRVNYEAGDDERSAQLLNLLQSEDFSYKHMAADRISWEKRLDEKLTDEMAKQLLQYMDETGFSAGRAQTRTVGMYAKLLGYSNNVKYRDVLQQVLASKAGVLVKKHAREALARLK